MVKLNSWLVRRNRSYVDSRILCIPYAGGGAASFSCWADKLPDNIELIIANLPGRESRFLEPAPSSIEEVVTAICAEIEFLDRKPLLLYGHSMGAVIAYEIGVHLQKKGITSPIALIVSGRIAPHLKINRKDIHKLEYEAFKERIREYKGTPPEILEDDDIFSVFEQTLRADFKLSETYQRSLSENLEQLTYPIVAYCGSADLDAPMEQMKEWGYYSKDFRFHCLPGGHFFIFEHGSKILGDMKNMLVNPAIRYGHQAC